MLKKRGFLKGGASALMAAAGTPAALAVVRPSLSDMAGQATWQAHLGQAFKVDGHAVTLRAVRPLTSRQPGEQFSLIFSGELPSSLSDGLHTLSRAGSHSLPLYLVRTTQGLRADFCRLQG
jgi:hypothetical protein